MFKIFFAISIISIFAIMIGIIEPSLVLWGNPRKHSVFLVLKTYGTIGILSLALFFLTANSTDTIANGSDKGITFEKNSGTEQIKMKLKADKITKDINPNMENTEITYEQLARTPDSYIGQKVEFSGRVIQVVQEGKETQLKLAIDEDYNKIILIGYLKDTANVRVLENDLISIEGTSLGLATYKSTLGGDIGIPAVFVDILKLK